MSEYENLRVERRDVEGTVGEIVYITMDSVSGKNSLTKEMGHELTDVANGLSEDDEVRCVVLRGSNGIYNTGADLSELEGSPKDGSTIKGVAIPLHDAISTLKRAEKPVITGVNGVAAGAGFGLAVFGDIVVMSEDAYLKFAYPNIGVTGDAGSTFFLPRLVGLRKATEIMMLDEPIGAEKAVELGLATEVVEPENFDQRLEEVAQKLGNGPTKAYGKAKNLLIEGLDSSLEDQMSREERVIAEATETKDYAEGIDKFFSEDDPEFVGR